MHVDVNLRVNTVGITEVSFKKRQCKYSLKVSWQVWQKSR
jgi:hypothetical protein